MLCLLGAHLPLAGEAGAYLGGRFGRGGSIPLGRERQEAPPFPFLCSLPGQEQGQWTPHQVLGYPSRRGGRGERGPLLGATRVKERSGERGHEVREKTGWSQGPARVRS